VSLKPWYKVVTPREDLREGKPLVASEFAVHLDHVRSGTALVRREREPQKDLSKAAQKAEGSESSFGLPAAQAGETKVDRIGATTLDRIHQNMILFGAGRGGALKRFLVEDGAGNDHRFWRLAQALSALYPASSEKNAGWMVCWHPRKDWGFDACSER